MNAINSADRHLKNFSKILDIELKQGSPCHVCEENRETCSAPKDIVFPSFKKYQDVEKFPCNKEHHQTVVEFYANLVLRVFATLYNEDFPYAQINPEVFIELRNTISLNQELPKKLCETITRPEYQNFLDNFLLYIQFQSDISEKKLVLNIIALFINLRTLVILRTSNTLSDSQLLY